MDRLKDKSLVVTGAAHGIGRAIALMAAQEGARMLLSDIDEVGGIAVRDEISATGATALFMQHDVSDADRMTEVIDAAVSQFGALDVMVNNAGIQLSCPVHETTLAQWRRVFAVNTESAFIGTSCALAHMMDRGQGSIVNLSSTLSKTPLELNAAYCASKAAVAQLTKVAALEAAAVSKRIRVNSVHPGVIATPMVTREMEEVARLRKDTTLSSIRAEYEEMCPLGLGSAEDIAFGVIYLASDEARYVTGTELVIDGGHLLT